MPRAGRRCVALGKTPCNACRRKLGEPCENAPRDVDRAPAEATVAGRVSTRVNAPAGGTAALLGGAGGLSLGESSTPRERRHVAQVYTPGNVKERGNKKRRQPDVDSVSVMEAYKVTA